MDRHTPCSLELCYSKVSRAKVCCQRSLLHSPMDFDHAPSLSPDLWMRIFAVLQNAIALGGNDDVMALKQNQLELHQPKLVCRQFRDIFATYPGLVQQVYISSTFSGRSLLSLLAWLQKTKGSVQAFQSADGGSLDASLTGLITSEQPIKVLDITLGPRNVTDNCVCPIPLVSAFARLEECVLSNRGEKLLDLTPLGALPSLSHLILSGRFKQLHHLTSLSHLVCTCARVFETQAFVPILQHLAIEDSYFVGIHTQGLSAYTALTQLVWRKSLMWDINQEVYLDPSLSVIPTNIGLLTQLHTLELHTALIDLGIAKLKWVSELTSLRELSITLCCCDVMPHIVSLTKLTCLKVSGRRHPTHQLPPHANLDIEWHRLQDLQDLHICQVMLLLGWGTASLLQLDSLRQMSFTGRVFFSEKDGGYFAALMHVFGRLRPQVNLIYDTYV